MGINASRPSRHDTERFLPADTLRVCNPSSKPCWCRRESHRDSRYYYIERRGDRGERLHDVFEFIPDMVMCGGWPTSWKNVEDRTRRDFEILGEVMKELSSSIQDQKMSEIEPWMSNLLSSSGMTDELGGSRGSSGRRRRREILTREYVVYFRARIGRIAKTCEQPFRNLDAHLGGPEEEQWREEQIRTWKEIQLDAMNGGMFGEHGTHSGLTSIGGVDSLNALGGGERGVAFDDGMARNMSNSLPASHQQSPDIQMPPTTVAEPMQSPVPQLMGSPLIKYPELSEEWLLGLNCPDEKRFKDMREWAQDECAEGRCGHSGAEFKLPMPDIGDIPCYPDCDLFICNGCPGMEMGLGGLETQEAASGNPFISGTGNGNVDGIVFNHGEPQHAMVRSQAGDRLAMPRAQEEHPGEAEAGGIFAKTDI